MDANIAKDYPKRNSLLLQARGRRLPDHSGMLKSAAEIRREKFSLEVAREGGAVKFADKHNMNPDYVRQLLNGRDHGGANIGNRAARKIEGLLGKPTNWLDHVGDVPLAIHSENDVIALQIAMRSLVKALAVATPLAAPVFAAQVRAMAEAERFSTKQALLANLLGIAEQDQRTEEASSPPARLRGSAGNTRR
jgi:hypothetical protein